MLNTTTLTLPGAEHPKENPLPFFGSAVRNTEVKTGPTLLPQDYELLGYETAPRYLPYKVQDRYERAKGQVTVPAILLENEHLCATFLPEYGGRLYSLYSKDLGRELLYKNPVLQPANLAILDAWISGGIEWNMGQFGHAVTTSSPVFCAACEDGEGNDFLRIYEYERMHSLVWQLDFHLPPGSEVLVAAARIQNTTERPTPLYYWSNIAAQEAEKTRVFSGTSDVLYLDMGSGEFGRGRLPHLPTMPEADASFPQAFDYSNEFFFQTPQEETAPWEAAVQPDGWMLYERSTQPLRYRKMFCWGTHGGGRRWKDYLSRPGEGDYVEIQAGVSPTQQHGRILEAGGVVEFVQCFGGATAGTEECIEAPWAQALPSVEKLVDAALPADAVHNWMERSRPLLDKAPGRLLCSGSGFGSLENRRRAKAGESLLPKALPFPVETMGIEQAPWLALLEDGVYPEEDGGCPASYMVGAEWEALLAQSLQKPEGQSAQALLQYGIMLAERGKDARAQELFQESLQKQPGLLAARCLGFLAARAGKRGEAHRYYSQSLQSGPAEQRAAVMREHMAFLNEWQEYATAWELYQSAQEAVKETEAVRLQALLPGLHCDALDEVRALLDADFAHVRENVTVTSDAWVLLHQLEEQRRTGTLPTPEEAEARWPVPYRLDFRMRS